MKIAEGLARRADIQKKLSELQGRFRASAQVQEGDQPVEDPQELVRQMAALSLELEALVLRLNRSNLQVIEGQTILDRITQRDLLKQQAGLMKALADAATVTVGPFARYSRTEIKTVPLVDPTPLREQADQLTAAARALDMEIQRLDWTTDMVD